MEKTRHQAVPSVYLVLLKDEQILLGRRRNTGWQDGKFGLISGHVEPGESVVAAMAREAKEEAGIEINPIHLKLACVMYRQMDRTNVDFFFTTTKWQGNILNVEPDKCEGWAFFPLDALPEDTIHYLQLAIRSAVDANEVRLLEYGITSILDLKCA